MNKIVFYKERDFGEKFNVTFEFVKQNWKILLRYALYGILPLAFVGALSLNSLMQVTLLYTCNRWHHFCYHLKYLKSS